MSMINAQLGKYLNVTLSGYRGNKSPYSQTVKIFTNAEYYVSFYDAESGQTRSVTGLVIDINGDSSCPEQAYITIKYREQVCPTNKPCPCGKPVPNVTNPPMPTCNCVLNPPADDGKYDDPKKVVIPVSNIFSIYYVINKDNKPQKPMRGTKVMILGISATTIRALVIRLDFIDDCMEQAIKSVDMEVGGIYNITYEDKKCGQSTIYEITGKLASIEEIDPCTRMCNTNPQFVRENVAFNGMVYTEDESCDKVNYMKKPPAREVKFVFDTSETFEGVYDTVYLTSIRDCTLIQAADGTTPPAEPEVPDTTCCENCPVEECNCDPSTCEYCKPKPPMPCKKYDLGDGYVVTIKGDDVVITKDGTDTSTSVADLLKFFVGIE